MKNEKEFIEKVEASGQYKILKKIKNFEAGTKFIDGTVKNTITAIIVDMETTGLNYNLDEAISVVGLKVKIDTDTNMIYSIEDTIEQFREPTRAQITPLIERLTSLTPKFLKGKKFNQEEMRSFIGENDIIISHNARFDSHFFNSHFEGFEGNQWLCSKDDIKWFDDYEIESLKLEFILFKKGYFYTAHNAMNDCYAVVSLLNEYPGALKSLLEQLNKKEFRVFAEGSPFSAKDELKIKGFKWNGDRKSWFKDRLTEEQVVDVLKIIDEIYGRADLAVIEEISGNSRFASV